MAHRGNSIRAEETSPPTSADTQIQTHLQDLVDDLLALEKSLGEGPRRHKAPPQLLRQLLGDVAERLQFLHSLGDAAEVTGSKKTKKMDERGRSENNCAFDPAHYFMYLQKINYLSEAGAVKSLSSE